MTLLVKTDVTKWLVLQPCKYSLRQLPEYCKIIIYFQCYIYVDYIIYILRVFKRKRSDFRIVGMIPRVCFLFSRPCSLVGTLIVLKTYLIFQGDTDQVRISEMLRKYASVFNNGLGRLMHILHQKCQLLFCGLFHAPYV